MSGVTTYALDFQIVNENGSMQIGHPPKHRQTSHLSDAMIDQIGCGGKFKPSPNNVENYSIDPLVLEDILPLPPQTLQNVKLPARYRLSTFTSMTVAKQHYGADEGHFSIAMKSVHH